MGVLDGKRVLVFDWDGTLLDSMPIKLRTFSETLAELAVAHVELPTAALSERVAALYRRLSGFSRRRIFEAVLEDLQIGSDAVSFAQFDAALRARNQHELLRTSLFPDAETFLTRLVSTSHALYVSSSVPRAELEFLFSRIVPPSLHQRFAGVFGSDGAFSKGVGHLSRIMEETRATQRDVLVFGDDGADAELSEQAGVACVLIDRHGRFGGRPGTAGCVRDFGELSQELAECQDSNR